MSWDPASKQPLYKVAATRIERLEAGAGASAPVPTNTASAPTRTGPPVTVGGEAAHVTELRA